MAAAILQEGMENDLAKRYFKDASERKGLFLVFEGGEASGKSTQAAILRDRLRAEGAKLCFFREPGSTKEGEEIRELLFAKEGCKFTPSAELLLFYAARAQLIATQIVPALKSGAIVICDRFKDSTMAYQHYALGISKQDITLLDDMIVADCLPDLTVFLNLPQDKLKSRLERRGVYNRYDEASLDFIEKVSRGYLEIFRDRELQSPGKAILLNSDADPEETAMEIWQAFSDLRKGAGHGGSKETQEL